MKQITNNVTVEDQYSDMNGQYRGANYGFVTTADGVVLIDTPEWPSKAIQLREKIRKFGDVKYIINTHEHIDHVTGNNYFPGQVVSHKLVKSYMEGGRPTEWVKLVVDVLFDGPEAKRKIEDIDKLERSELSWKEALRFIIAGHDDIGSQFMDHYQIKRPSITFSDELEIELGNHTFQLTHYPGHTNSHIGVYIPEEKVFFAGDNLGSGCYPSLASSVPYEWVDSLNKISSLDIVHAVPGHGEVCGVDEIKDFASFLDICFNRVEEAIDDGLSVEEAVDEVTFNDLRPAIHPTPASHMRQMKHLYEELS